MRLWSIHPKYLDSRGLVALWRETLLAKNVLAGKTKGYTKHPQLLRFKEAEDPMIAINSYLLDVYNESLERGYNFNPEKFDQFNKQLLIPVSSGQIEYEFRLLLHKFISGGFLRSLNLIAPKRDIFIYYR